MGKNYLVTVKMPQYKRLPNGEHELYEYTTKPFVLYIDSKGINHVSLYGFMANKDRNVIHDYFSLRFPKAFDSCNDNVACAECVCSGRLGIHSIWSTRKIDITDHQYYHGFTVISEDEVSDVS